MELTFTAQNQGQYVPLDSILIENLTQGGDTTLYAPDTVLVLDYVAGIGNNEAIIENGFSVSQNYPNPFTGKTEINLYLLEKEFIKINVRDILGRELAKYENMLNQGKHSFAFYPSNEMYYILTVTGKQTSKTIKMLNTNINTDYTGNCKIIYNGHDDNAIGIKSQRLRRVATALAEKAVNDFGFGIGDELKYTCYSDIGEMTIIDSPTGNQTYTFHYSGNFCPGMPTITDIDGNMYNTVLIGNQCWMKENLETTTYRNGTSIPNVTSDTAWENLTTGAYVWYDNDISWKGPYGALYNWFATVDANGLCPTGWHVPTNDEWTALTDFIGGTGFQHGNELKSCRQVNSPLGGGCNTTEHPRWNEDIGLGNYGTDDYGFSGLPGGYREFFGAFEDVGDIGTWWSSSEGAPYYTWFRSLGYYFSGISVNSDYKPSGFSVRCLRDY